MVFVKDFFFYLKKKRKKIVEKSKKKNCQKLKKYQTLKKITQKFIQSVPVNPIYNINILVLVKQPNDQINNQMGTWEE